MTHLISLDQCEPISPTCFVKIMQGDKLPKGGGVWVLKNEVKPSDLYCYLYAKFGKPNGLQNFLRKDDSDNLIHWEWCFAHEHGLMLIMGLNMRTEIHLIGAKWHFSECSKEQFIEHIKRDIANYGKNMSEIRSNLLEDWEIISNPYRQLKDSIGALKRQLDELGLNPALEHPPHISAGIDAEKVRDEWAILTEKYNQGIGLSMAIRAMTPVLAESFLNILIFILCRPDIKNNERLYNNFIRSNIDIKVQSLHINCLEFNKPVDWKAEPCARYNTVVNERNDMLHGNVVTEKLKFSEIFFNGRVPVFKKYESMWQHAIGTSIDAAGIDRVMPDIEAVNSFIDYVLSCVSERSRESVQTLINRSDIGINKKTKRLGALLPEAVADFWCSIVPDGSASERNDAEGVQLVDESGEPLTSGLTGGSRGQ